MARGNGSGHRLRRRIARPLVPLPQRQLFTVIGCADDQGQEPFAAVVSAGSAGKAERTVDPALRVVLVLEGQHEVNAPDEDIDGDAQWTVAGFYPDNDQRYATTVRASDLEGARTAAREQSIDDGFEAVIVAVIRGEQHSADSYVNGEYWAGRSGT